MNELKKIQYNCRKATFLIEKRMIDKITFREAIELRIHLAGCSVCKIFDRQSQLINSMVRQLFNPAVTTDIRLDDRYKKELHDKIEEEMNKN
jgi:hypothetical protein